MALNDAGFIQEIKDLQDEMIQALDYESAKTVYATKLMIAVKNYIKSGTVTTTVSTSVITTGTATNHTGSGSGTGTGTIS